MLLTTAATRSYLDHSFKDDQILLFGREFWTRLIDFDVLVETGMISPEDAHLFHFVETAEEAWAVLSAQLEMQRASTA